MSVITGSIRATDTLYRPGATNTDTCQACWNGRQTAGYEETRRPLLAKHHKLRDGLSARHPRHLRELDMAIDLD